MTPDNIFTAMDLAGWMMATFVIGLIGGWLIGYQTRKN